MANADKLFLSLFSIIVLLSLAASVSAEGTNINNNSIPLVSFSPSIDSPKIKINTNLTFSLTKSDADNDTLNVSWYNSTKLVSTSDNYTFVAGNDTGTFLIKAVVSDNKINVSKTWSLIVADKPVASTFDPSFSTNFSNITDFSNVSNLHLGNSRGSLKLNSGVNLTNVIDIDNAVNLSAGYVEVKTSLLPEFADKPATLVMNNLSSFNFTKKPLIKVTFENGTSNPDCESLGLCTNVSWIDNALKFDVKHFTSFMATANTTQETQSSKLVFDKIKVIMPSHKETVVSGQTVDKVKPGDSISVDVEVRNSGALEIHDVSVEGKIEKIDNGDDLEDDSQDFDLDAGDDKKVSLKFQIPYNADKISYPLKLKLTGQDSAGKNYETTATINLLIDKKSHALAISKLSLNVPSVKCSRAAELSVKVNNIGENEEDGAVLKVVQQELGFNVKENKELDEGSADEDDESALSKTYVINVPRNFKAGVYTINAKAYYSGTKLSDEKNVDLIVEDCVEVKQASAVQESKQMLQQKKAQLAEKVDFISANLENAVRKESEDAPNQELLDEGMYITLLVVGVILLAGAVSMLAMVFTLKRR